jgi:hypothetical protein
MKVSYVQFYDYHDGAPKNRRLLRVLHIPDNMDYLNSLKRTPIPNSILGPFDVDSIEHTEFILKNVDDIFFA